MDKRFDSIMEFLSRSDKEYFDEKVKELEKGITIAKKHINEFVKKKKKLEAYVKAHPDSVDEDYSVDEDKEFMTLMNLYNDTIQELYSAEKAINIDMIPEQSKSAQTVNKISVISGTLSIIVALIGSIKKECFYGGLAGAAISVIIERITNWNDFVRRWNKKLDEFKKSGADNMTIFDAAKLLDDQIKDLINEMEKKYWFFNK